VTAGSGKGKKELKDLRFKIADLRLIKGLGHKEESTALIIRTPVGASFACDERTCELGN
jgi:hypothetical protein